VAAEQVQRLDYGKIWVIFLINSVLYVNHFGKVFSDEFFSIVKLMNCDFYCHTIFLNKVHVNFSILEQSSLLFYSFDCKSVILDNRELKQTRTATATKTPSSKSLMSKTIAVPVRYKSLYVSLPSSAKQQREMTKFWVF